MRSHREESMASAVVRGGRQHLHGARGVFHVCVSGYVYVYVYLYECVCVYVAS